MSDHRPNESYNSLEDIVKALDGKHSSGVWIGKNYSKADLIRDLQRIDMIDKSYDSGQE